MSSPRLRRLAADYELVCNEFAGHDHVDVQAIGGNPPEIYRVTYRLEGIALDRNNRIVNRSNHVAMIQLTNEYPRQKPKCVLETPIFHPNFGSYICVGDHWAAGETLADLIVKIGDMIQYRDYNVKSPLNARAAQWAAENERLFPIGNIDLYQPEPDIELTRDDSGENSEDEPMQGTTNDGDITSSDFDIVFENVIGSSDLEQQEDIDITLD